MALRITDYSECHYDDDLNITYFECSECGICTIRYNHNFCPSCSEGIEWDVMTDEEEDKLEEEIEKLYIIYEEKLQKAMLFQRKRDTNENCQKEKIERQKRIDDVKKWHEEEKLKLQEKYWHK